MTNIYHGILNIPVEFTPIFPKEPPRYITPYALSLNDKALVDWLSRLNLKVKKILLFYMDPERVEVGTPHVDSNVLYDNQVKINFVYSTAPSIMRWYQPKQGVDVRIQTEQTMLAHPYLGANADDIEIVHTAQIGTPSLVNVGQLHDIANVTAPRYCFSFILEHKKQHTLLNWDEAVIIFKDYLTLC